MGRLEREHARGGPTEAVAAKSTEPDLRERLGRVGHEIESLQARIVMLEQALADERGARLEAGALLASESLRVRELELELERTENSAAQPNERVSRELETAWMQIHALRAALGRASTPWWRRRAGRT